MNRTNRTNRTARIPALIAAALLAAAGAAQAQATIDHNKALAGNITPGDLAGYPITISRPGHYKLMGNLTVPPGFTGIEVQASDVTLDLNGFTVAGPGSCARDVASRVVTCQGSGGGLGIHITAEGGVTVQGGTVRGFYRGISGNAAETLIRVRLTQNSSTGFVAPPNGQQGTRIVDSIADLNGASGIVLSRGLVQSTRVAGNGQYGISGTGQVVVQDSMVLHNLDTGLLGLIVRGTLTRGNGTNRQSTTSLGGNVDGTTPF